MSDDLIEELERKVAELTAENERLNLLIQQRRLYTQDQLDRLRKVLKEIYIWGMPYCFLPPAKNGVRSSRRYKDSEVREYVDKRFQDAIAMGKTAESIIETYRPSDA